jgi:hypothetical protein
MVIVAGCATHSVWQEPPEEYARPPRHVQTIGLIGGMSWETTLPGYRSGT